MKNTFSISLIVKYHKWFRLIKSVSNTYLPGFFLKPNLWQIMHIFAEFDYCKIEFHYLWSNMLQFICFDLRANSTVSCSYLIPNNWIFRCVVVWKLKCIHCSTISSQSVYNLSSFDKGRKVHSRLLCWQVFVIR